MIGHIFNYEIPVITVVARDTKGSRKQLLSIIIFNFNPAPTVKSACTTHAMQHTHTVCTQAGMHARTHLHSRTQAKNLFSRTFFTSREYSDYGYLKLKGMANNWSAISRLEIDGIRKIKQNFEQYDFYFKIVNWATWVMCFTCSTFFLLTVSFFRIFYEIAYLKKNVKVHIRKLWGFYMKVASFCFKFCYRASKLEMSFFVWSEVTPPKKIVRSPLKMKLKLKR